MMVRINGLDTHYMYRDVVDIVEACPRLDMILIPKVGVRSDVYAIDMLVTQIEAAKKRDKRIGFEVLIETALGMANVEAIAQSSRRLEAMCFGVADYAASTRARTTVIGGVNADYGVLTDKDAEGERQYFWADPWHAAQTRMMVACRAYGLRPIDGPFGDFCDPDGFIAAANRAAVLGYEGKWAIHPSQIELANKVFTPSDAEVNKARRIMEAMAQAAQGGQGRGLARRPPDRHRQHPHGRGAAGEGQLHRRRGLRVEPPIRMKIFYVTLNNVGGSTQHRARSFGARAWRSAATGSRSPAPIAGRMRSRKSRKSSCSSKRNRVAARRSSRPSPRS